MLRYAPTPSGYLHRGNAFNFLLTHRLSKQVSDGRILLRIDDLDADRKRPEYVEDVFRSLKWLGLPWQLGPRDVDDFEKNWSQHHRLPLYQTALDVLRDKQLLFACNKSRRELAAYNGKYPESFRAQGLSLNSPEVNWRIKTPPGFPLPDFVVRKRDGLPAYQLASLADDRYFNISYIVRGADLQDSTAAQRYLADCLEWTEFLNIKIYHHPLLTDQNGQKLSKSEGSPALKTMYEQGISAKGLVEEFEKWVANLKME